VCLRHEILGSVALALSFCSVVCTSTLVAQEVLTDSGPMSGVNEGGLAIYEGISFAAPPGRRLAVAAAGSE
jgi:hypothetical protein